MPESAGSPAGPQPAKGEGKLLDKIGEFFDSGTKITYGIIGLVIAIAALITTLRSVIPHHPTLIVTATCKLSTTRIQPGSIISLSYTIRSNTGASVGLGAGIYDDKAIDHSTGFGDIASFPLNAGQNADTRPVSIPADLPPGRYEVDGEIWPANQVGDDGANTMAGPTCGWFTVPSGPPTASLGFPTSKAKVSKEHGFIATGQAKSLGVYTIWILDSHGSYTVDSEAQLAGTKWSAPDFPIGDSSQHPPFNLTLAAVLANQTCANKLYTVLHSNNDYLSQLPSGCTVFTQVNVTVAYP